MQDDEAAIRRLVSSWLEASKTGDSQTIRTLMSEDVVFLIPGQDPVRGRSEFESAQDAMQHFDIEANSRIEELKVLGEWAYLWTHLSVAVRSKSGGEPIRRAGNTLSILRKLDGHWVFHRDANLLAPSN